MIEESIVIKTGLIQYFKIRLEVEGTFTAFVRVSLEAKK